MKSRRKDIKNSATPHIARGSGQKGRNLGKYQFQDMGTPSGSGSIDCENKDSYENSHTE